MFLKFSRFAPVSVFVSGRQAIAWLILLFLRFTSGKVHLWNRRGKHLFKKSASAMCILVQFNSVEETSHSFRPANPRVDCEVTSRKCIVIRPEYCFSVFVDAACCVPHFPNSILTPCQFIETHGIGVSRCLNTGVSTFLTSLSTSSSHVTSTSRSIVNIIHKCIHQQIKSLTHFST